MTRPEPDKSTSDKAETGCRLTQEEIRRVVSQCLCSDHTEFITSVTDNRLYPREVFDRYADRDVIEIGPGQSPFKNYFDCKSYRWADARSVLAAKAPDIRLQDGLSFLRDQPDASAAIVSFWVFDSDVMRGLRIGPRNVGRDVHHQYMERLAARTRTSNDSYWLNTLYMFELAEEIRRVAQPGSILYGQSVEWFFWPPDISIGWGVFDWGGVYEWK